MLKNWRQALREKNYFHLRTFLFDGCPRVERGCIDNQTPPCPSGPPPSSGGRDGSGAVPHCLHGAGLPAHPGVVQSGSRQNARRTADWLRCHRLPARRLAATLKGERGRLRPDRSHHRRAFVQLLRVSHSDTRRGINPVNDTSHQSVNTVVAKASYKFYGPPPACSATCSGDDKPLILLISGGSDGTRTRDLRRDRPPDSLAVSTGVPTFWCGKTLVFRLKSER